MKKYEISDTLPYRTYTIIRIDGRAFHTLTRVCKTIKPYDETLSMAMDEAANALISQMMGSCFAYGQSDEYSFLLTDFENPDTQAWFGGNIQKITSVAASTFTSYFHYQDAHATFDARCFTLPSPYEVKEYFIWRQQDCIRNSISMLAHNHFSPNALHGKSGFEMMNMLTNKGIDFYHTVPAFRLGRVLYKTSKRQTITHKVTGEIQEFNRNYWEIDNNIPIFTDESSYLEKMIPRIEI